MDKKPSRAAEGRLETRPKCSGSLTGHLLVLTVGLLLTSAVFAEAGSSSRPLILFSTLPTANDDLGLRNGLALEPTTILSYGENLIADRKILIIQGRESQSDSYASLRQLAEFIIQNSVHGGGKSRPLQENVEILFYSDQPLVLSCGKISVFFRDLVSEFMGVDRARIRHITMHDDKSLDPSSVTKGYLRGGHAVVEIFFPELGKWAVFDLDKGILPSLDRLPLSMIEIQALGESEVAFNPIGRDEFGKGAAARQGVNTYYASARDCFGIKTGQEYVFLFSKPSRFGDVFRENFESATNRRAVIITDAISFRDRFYRASGPPEAEPAARALPGSSAR